MADLISLFQYNQRNEDFLPYLIFQTYQPEAIQCLSPDIMRLTDSIFVADLAIVKDYWLKVAEKKTLKVSDLLQKVISENLPDCPLSLFCEHPFQGLVFFNHLKVLETRGHFRTDSLFAQKVYQNMGWYPWTLSARQVYDCFDKAHCLKKERQHFPSQLNRFSRFVERVDLQEFSELKQAHFFELSRRFKGFIGLLWKWTFPRESSTPQQLGWLTHQHYAQLDGFPWIPFFEDQALVTENLLEFPVSDWELVQERLFDDFDKLSRKEEVRSPYKVLQLQWRLILFDLSQVEQVIGFKTPLCFESEREGEFQTLIKQFQFAFDDFKQQLIDRDRELEFVNTPLIVGWQIEVQKGLILTEKSGLLDFDEQMQKLHQEDLLSITNKVKSGIKSFKTFDNFITGMDFTEKDLLETVSSESLPGTFLGPFYLLPKEQEISASEIKSRQFLDRTSSDWWNRQDNLDSYRDCFLCELKDDRFVFAYRNYKGRWFCYGS